MVEVYLFVELDFSTDAVVLNTGFHDLHHFGLSITSEARLVTQLAEFFSLIDLRAALGSTQDNLVVYGRLFAMTLELVLGSKPTFLHLFLCLNYVSFSLAVLNSLGWTRHSLVGLRLPLGSVLSTRNRALI